MRKLQNPRANGITEGVIWKQLLIFFFPILLGTFFQQLYNTVDAIVVGNFVGKEALAAVGGSTGTIINLLVGFFTGLASGATVIISQFYGANRIHETKDALHTSMALAIVGGFVLMVVGIIVSPYALKAMDTPDDIMDYSLTYIRIYFGGMIANMIYNIGSGILRAMGDAKRPLYFLIACCIVNLVLDLVFVVGFKMAVTGVAVATVLAQIFSAVLVIVALVRADESYRLSLKEIRFHFAILKQILYIGFPAGLQSVMYSVSNLIVQVSINGFGTDTLAAWTAFGKIDSMFWMVIGAFGISITTFAGQNFGAGKYDRIKKSVKVCLGMSAGATVFLSVFLLLTGPYIYHLFTSDQAVIEKGMDILNLLVPTYITFICIEILSGAIRGTGDSLIPTILTCVGVCVLRILWVVIAVPISPTIQTAISCYPFTWIITSILFVIYYLRGDWLRRRIEKTRFA